ncbi:MAG: polysaccharide deacetylase family protein [Oscillospiraceae bacterium]|nr:polysaccharide deacetylase family protein [Oscillospiraceae bacterium]
MGKISRLIFIYISVFFALACLSGCVNGGDSQNIENFEESDRYEEPAVPAWSWIESLTEQNEEPEERDYIDITEEPEEETTKESPETETEVEIIAAGLVYKELVFFAERNSTPGIYDGEEKLVALTFDDGPGIYTNELLDILDENDGYATFFVLGSKVEAYAQTIRNIVEQGSEVAGHSWSHTSFLQLERDEIKHELQATNAAIFNAAGVRPQICRVPYGAYDDLVLDVSYELGMAVIQWNFDPRDWQLRNADAIYDIIMQSVRHGSIIVLHDIHAQTIDAMERLIPDLTEEGFKLVTVSQILGGTEPGVLYR